MSNIKILFNPLQEELKQYLNGLQSKKPSEIQKKNFEEFLQNTSSNISKLELKTDQLTPSLIPRYLIEVKKI